MTRRLLATVAIAAVMAMAGTYLLYWRMGHAENPIFLPQLVAVSVLLWLEAARLIVRRSLALPWALLIGLVSPLVGGFFMPFGIWVVLKFPEVCFPIGLTTGYCAWRVMTSPWRAWSSP